MGYIDLQVTSNFSFLRGASHPEELVEQAADYGYKEIAITDRNTLAGIVRAHVAAKKKNMRIIVGCRLDLMDGPSLLAYPTDKAAYSRLCRLLTTGNLRAEKGDCHLYKKDVYEHAEGMKFIIVPPEQLTTSFDFAPPFKEALKEYSKHLGNQVYLATTRSYLGDDQKKLYQLSQLSSSFHIPLVATNDVHYHHAERRQLQDILTCVREKCTISNAGFRLHPNAERYVKPIPEMHRLFRQYPDAVKNTQEIAQACQFSLDSLQYVYPQELTEEGRTPQEELTHLAWKGARERYGDEIPEKISAAIHHELTFIAEMNYASYFLTVHDIVRFARKQDILCQGRGSAANSTVCYCLGITSVDPTQIDLLFERFISSARNEPPDIDVDFEHERREEVMQYIYNKYGRDRAAIVATVTQQHHKGAIRDVGKAMGLSVDTINRLSSSIWHHSDEEFSAQRVAEQGLDTNDPHLKKVMELTEQMVGFPRQLGQHTGGFVITADKLSDLCPILNARMENRTCIEWNKDDIDALGFLKIDVLALGMLTCIRKAFDLAKAHHNEDFTLANIPQEDPEVYKMISRADTIGVFQIESRAQQSMLPRLRPERFYDLVIEVAIVRPGPIQGGMVHPYLRRRNGEEDPDYPSEELKGILSKTMGVPLFQEQAMQIAMVAADFSAAEADELRRSMATFKAKGIVSKFEKKLIEGMKKKGYDEEFARRIFKQLEGFGSYGFPESHAASFALLVYVSSYLKCFYPDVFACALLNSMPMGFYQPAQIVSDARKHNVEVRPVDVNLSNWDNTLEEIESSKILEQSTDKKKSIKCCALRLGFRQVRSLQEDEVKMLISARKAPFTNILSIREAGVSQTALEKLADADAFRSLGLDRRQALWEISALGDRPIGMFTGSPSESAVEKPVNLPKMTDSEHVVHDYSALSLSLKAHPVSFVREKLSMLHIRSVSELESMTDGMPVRVAGLILVRQRPGTASGICFITIEDETGCANLVVFQKLYQQFRKEILQSKLLMVEGKVQREGEVIHVIVKRCYNLTKLLHQLTAVKEENMSEALSAAEMENGLLFTEDKPAETQGDTQEIRIPGARNFR
ncbi:error-prone DNA polymerase [Chitinophaga filiformis]|uniref:DNA polymerase III subunit alpha n=1 Tax=Chitinophaga filiformis TaxID=104663 RepID=A0A1G7XTG7_CHIFI|nr:error-prone DNA polymerase [Chitinophaga filiformis]SDG87431.1 error-prone DNA polymerase [Chitinophaga filiformis]